MYLTKWGSDSLATYVQCHRCVVGNHSMAACYKEHWMGDEQPPPVAMLPSKTMAEFYGTPGYRNTGKHLP